jgi:hypothetical protein
MIAAPPFARRRPTSCVDRGPDMETVFVKDLEKMEEKQKLSGFLTARQRNVRSGSEVQICPGTVK